MNKNEFQDLKKILDNNQFFDKKQKVYVDKRLEDYSQNFGVQWNKFPLTQFDSHTGFPLTKNRLFQSSEWKQNDLKDKIIIELGSGAGRFTEILLATGSYVVSVEMSNAVFVNSYNNTSENVIFIKSSLNNLDFLNELFDYVFCYGVAQHTPNVLETYKSLYGLGKKNSKISVDHYLKFSYPTTKSIWRPLTKKIEPRILLKILETYIPFYFPIDTFIKTKLPSVISKLLRIMFPIPCVNYTGVKDIPQSKNKLIEWAVMDTLDALGAKYDEPLSKSELENIAKNIGLIDFVVKERGPVIVLNGVK